MLVKLKTFIKEHQLIDNSDQIALAISGGKDSVFAAHMLNELEQPFVLVHCNFKLRGRESNEDEQFVSVLASQLSYCNGIFIKHFDTTTFAAHHKLSIQEAARNLRYAYFKELKNMGVFSKLITAHHQSDSLETFFINLYRISGIKGLLGIPKERGYIVRPFLAFTSAEISDYIHLKKIQYREDRSNEDTKYLRNKLRKTILPFIEEQLPSFGKNTLSSLAHLESENELLQYLIQKEIKQIAYLQDNTGMLSIQKKSIQSYPQPALILYSILDKFGFNYSQCHQIVALSNAKSGKRFSSNTHQLLVDRKEIIVTQISFSKDEKLTITGPGSYSLGKYVVTLKSVNKAIYNNKRNEEVVEIPPRLFPLTLRTWEEGDKIQPLGMKGTKLLSDFFIDEKIDVFNKESIPLLCKDKNVLWISNHRISDNIKVKSTANLYQITIYHEDDPS